MDKYDSREVPSRDTDHLSASDRVKAMTVQEIQQDRLTTEDLTPYEGSWVAIRDGKVVASALDALELRNNEVVRDEDLLILVPTRGTGTFIL